MPRRSKCDNKPAKAADAVNVDLMEDLPAALPPRSTAREGHGAAGLSGPKRSTVHGGRLSSGKVELKQQPQQRDDDLEQHQRQLLRNQVQFKLMLLRKQKEQQQEHKLRIRKDNADDDEAGGRRECGSNSVIEDDVNVAQHGDHPVEQHQGTGLDNQELSELERVKKQLEALQREVNLLRASVNDGLQRHKVVAAEASFTDVPGFPDTDWLMGEHVRANPSDYVFVRRMMMRLFPQGVGNATPTGNPSPNPGGRRKNNAVKHHHAARRDRIDPTKMEWMTERLRERRMILRDSPAEAAEAARLINQHVTRVICNNPKMRL